MKRFLFALGFFVLCCCRTYNGSCCAEVSFCTGFVPGCMCSGAHPEQPGEAYQCKLTAVQS